MKPLIFKEVEIREPRWDNHPEKSTTDNKDWKQGMFVVFEDSDGNVFDWMPKWIELEKLFITRDNVEEINKNLAIKNFYKKNEISML